MNQEELNEILRLHKLWIKGDKEGVIADLFKANLRGADLSEADLTGAYLRGASLTLSNLSRAYLLKANLRRADLSGAALTDANLRRADLSGANLSGADLYRANLRRSDLSGSNLSEANLSNADLTGAYLFRSDLTHSYLSGAKLPACVGNDREIKNIDTTVYEIAYTSEVIQIGCQNHTIDEWRNFSDEEISAMDEGALDWWKENKEMIFTTIEEDPATPTNKKQTENEND